MNDEELIHRQKLNQLAVLSLHLDARARSVPCATPPNNWNYSKAMIIRIENIVLDNSEPLLRQFGLHPLCHWFAALKQRRSDAWLNYFRAKLQGCH
jgi:hypothetical protein